MSLIQFEAAAWLPCPTSPEAHRAGLRAVQRWVHEQERRVGAESVLFTETFHVDPHYLFRDFRRGVDHFSVRSSGGRTSGPVLALHPSWKVLERAQYKAMSAICVWEGHVPMRGWAGQVGAVDLSTGEPTTPDRGLVEPLEELVLAGNNGYADKPGERDARRVLSEIRALGLLGHDLPSAVVAHDLSDQAAERLATLIKSLTR